MTEKHQNDSIDGMDKKRETLSGRPPEQDGPSAPAPIDPKTGMHKDYWVLPEEERKKGFVRPLRRSYRHVGVRPRFKLRDLTPEEQKRHKGRGYVKYEEYPENEEGSIVGRYWTESMLNSGCGTVTTMGLKLAETCARDPKYYGATFCCHCGAHLPVGEFVWEGTNERMGS